MKRRLSASIDDDLLTAAENAVREGYAPSVSALVEDALRIQMERTRKLAAVDDFLEYVDNELGWDLDGEEADRAVAEVRATAIRPNARPADGDAAAAA